MENKEAAPSGNNRIGRIGRVIASTGVLAGAVYGHGAVAHASSPHNDESSQSGCNFGVNHIYNTSSGQAGTHASSMGCSLYAKVKIFYGDTSGYSETEMFRDRTMSVSLNNNWKKSQHYARTITGTLVGYEIT